MNKTYKILVFSADKGNRPAHFVGEQVAALRATTDVHIDVCTCSNKINVFGKYINLKNAIKQYQPNIVHAHFGLYGFIANLQRKVPVVTTYHGSDIHGGGIVSCLSKISAYLSAFNIYVSEALKKQSQYKGENAAVIPCGVNIENFKWVDKKDALERLGLQPNKKYILFASDFSTPVKDPELAFQSIVELRNLCPNDKIELIELKGYSREEVNLLMHAVDSVLMTSHREGSPQFIKEAVACGTPIVTVNVGDVEMMLKDVANAYVAQGRNPREIAQLLYQTLLDSSSINGKEQIIKKGFDNDSITQRLLSVYDIVRKND